MASLADLLTQLQEAEAAQQVAPRAPWRGPGERPAPGVNTPDMMPRAYRELQPYPVNIPAAIEGLGAMAGVTGGPANAVTSGAKAVAGSPLAQKLAAAGATILGLTAPSMANKGEGQAGQSMAPSNQAYLDLLGQQSALQKRLDEARAKMEAAQRSMDLQEKTGRGPKYNEALQSLTQAKADFSGLDTQMKALIPAIANEQKKTDPAYLLELKQEEDKVAEEKKRRTMNTSVKEMFSDVAPVAPAGSAVLALAAGKGIKGAYVDKYNKNMNELSTRWGEAVKGTNKGLAEALQKEATDLAAKGPGGTWSAIGTGIGIGELGQVLPVAADYAKAVPGSDLYKKTVEGMQNPAEVGGRMFTGALLGGIPAKVGSSFAARNAVRPTGYAAETRSMPDPGPSQPPSSPSSPNGLGPQGSGTSTMSPQGPAGTAANSNTSLADLLRSGAVTTEDMLGAMNIKPANKAANPSGLPKHLTQDDRLSGSKIRNKKTGRIEPDPLKKD